jgi:predicted O-methyltransferase YrrM
MRTPMLVLQRVQDKVEREVHGTLKNGRELAALAGASDPVSAAVGRALEATLHPPVDTVAAAWSERIETLRARLAGDHTPVSGLDFGAGSPREPRSAADMARGVRWEKPISVIATASKNRTWGMLLFQLVRALKPTTCIELGTCVGISAAYQAAALAANGTGTLVTLEGAESLAALSRANLTQLELANVRVVAGAFHTTLAGVLHENPVVDYAYIDGHHDEQATLAYFEQILPHVPKGGVLVFDDIRWSVGMNRAWDAVGAHERVRTVVDLFQVGVCVIGDSSVAKRHHKLAIA